MGPSLDLRERGEYFPAGGHLKQRKKGEDLVAHLTRNGGGSTWP
jgi:hypothetical protein